MKPALLKVLLGPLLFALCFLIGDSDQIKILGIILWMLCWWVTTALPIGATALLPIILFPITGILSLRETTANYANPVIFLFMGGFILGLAIEKWNLHKRIALNIIKRSGDNPNRIIFGCMFATALLSMWISNTATAVMMLPIGMSIVKLLDNAFEGEKSAGNFGLTLMMGIAFAANIGGVSTIIGTPPNLVLASIVDESGLPPVEFSSWIVFAFPLSVLLFATTYFVNTRVVFPIRITKIAGIGPLINDQLKEIGRMGKAEKRVSIVLLVAALSWVFRAQIARIELLSELSDPVIAIIASVVLFAFPSGEDKKPLLVWDDTRKLPWGILLLFGGGISLAKGMEVTHVVEVLGNLISKLNLTSALLIILIITAFSVFLTEVMSNVAMVAVFIPVSFVIARNFGLDEMQLAVPLTIGASCAFMFPISTPPNAIVYSSGYIKMSQMALAGFILNVLSILIIAVYCYYFQPS